MRGLPRHHPRRNARSGFAAGLIALFVLGAGALYAFLRPNPFHDPFQLEAVVTSVTGVTPGITPVRIAGVDVGEVAAVQSFRGTRRSIVTLTPEGEDVLAKADAIAAELEADIIQGLTTAERERLIGLLLGAARAAEAAA